VPYPTPTPTFWMEPTTTVQVGLRRYRMTDGNDFTCAGGYHRALVITGEAPAVFHATEWSDRMLDVRPETPHDDPRWPAACECGYAFTDADQWQDWQELVYAVPGTDTRYVLNAPTTTDGGGCRQAPPGAMWDSWWMPDGYRGPDGIALTVRLPNGSDWCPDGPATGGGRWTRTGDPRHEPVTVTPSIASREASDPLYYHGFLTEGVLTPG
jgi:hypothetical protein